MTCSQQFYVSKILTIFVKTEFNLISLNDSYPGKQKTGKKTSLFFSDDCASRLDIFSNPTLSWLVRNHLESYNPVLAR